MKVDVPSGKGKVVLTFIPYGLKTGSLISLLASIIFCCYAYFIRKTTIIQKADYLKLNRSGTSVPDLFNFG